MELEPEIHRHRHSLGHRWIDLALALSALALSIASIIIAIQNEAAMKRLVTANSWPHLELSHGNARDGQAVIHFDVRNSGIGPATLDKLVVRYRDQPVRSHQELLERCCAAKSADVSLEINAVTNHVFTPREDVGFLAVPRDGANAAVWDKLSVERFKVDMGVCYSSVFAEHWITTLKNPKPLKVKSCDELSGPAYEPNLYGTDAP